MLCKINWFRILTESSSKNLNNNYYHRLRQFENENFQLKLAFRVQLNGLPLRNRFHDKSRVVLLVSQEIK